MGKRVRSLYPEPTDKKEREAQMRLPLKMKNQIKHWYVLLVLLPQQKKRFTGSSKSISALLSDALLLRS